MPEPLYKRWVPPSVPAPIQPQPAQSPEVVARGTSSSPTRTSTPMEAKRPAKKPKKRKRDCEHEQEGGAILDKHKNILSKFEKASRLAEVRKDQEPAQQDEEDSQEELKDLQPMPQPAPVPEPAYEPTFSTLPPWLAQPVAVEASKSAPFGELGVDSFFQKTLEKNGFSDALAVQVALLPMLYPGYKQHLGDVCVSAKTGSGKTLAYLLPIVESLKHRVVPCLAAVIIVPSRQLVNQARQVAEDLCAGTKIKVGTAVGNVAFSTEQKQLVKIRPQYNPSRVKELQELRRKRHGYAPELGTLFEDYKNANPNPYHPIYVPLYDYGCDILICTPGRLVEHLEKTTGFLLNNLKWLVIDEADQLLNQNYQGWTNVLMSALENETPEWFMTPEEFIWKREREAKSWISRALPPLRKPTKIVLSATMEKDLNKLGMLKLTRPKLVLVQDETTEVQALANDDNVFELPSTLDEYALHVGDGSNKPLHLLYLLVNHVFPGLQSRSKENGSESSSSSSSSDSDSDSNSDSDSDSEQKGEASLDSHPNRVLVFTKSTESASRLSHLLSTLEPALKSGLETMTRALTADAARKLLRSFNTGATKILIASDAASRGLDIPGLSHVINYDMPTSITSYVHRVGRTARAGKAGEACTLFTKTEAAWFLKQVAAGESIKRGNKKVTRLNWKESTVTADGRKKVYRAALKDLESAVTGADSK